MSAGHEEDGKVMVGGRLRGLLWWWWARLRSIQSKAIGEQCKASDLLPLASWMGWVLERTENEAEGDRGGRTWY
ncbi:unnamed protein product [Clonostachys chloroleuca]|uniref:Uncharacterized protein n=1 Tax=Clonostachys chloroleuca TaxID=1926264 RepID=A0AA35MAA3_9HYPO|nr:unnamed protein product [Clonostachys chloroleuca]